MNVIAQLKFELTYYNVALQYVSHFITGTPSIILKKCLFYSTCDKTLKLQMIIVNINKLPRLEIYLLPCPAGEREVD